MLKELLEQRRAHYERSTHDLAWERQQIQARLTEIDRVMAELGGAIYEIDQVTRDLATEAAIEAAKAQEVKPNE